MLFKKKTERILNSDGLKQFLNKKFPNLVLESRSKQFIECYIINYLKVLIKESCLLAKHRKSKILQLYDLRCQLIKQSKECENSSYFFEKLVQKKKKKKLNFFSIKIYANISYYLIASVLYFTFSDL